LGRESGIASDGSCINFLAAGVLPARPANAIADARLVVLLVGLEFGATSNVQLKLFSSVTCDGKGSLVDAAYDCGFFNSFAARAFEVGETSSPLEDERIKVLA
jgi:hypothetical protein